MHTTIDRMPTITDADVRTYRERGYWISPKLFSDDQIAATREAIFRLMRGEKDGQSNGWFNLQPIDPAAKNLKQWVNAWWVSFGVRRAVLSPVVGYVASRLMQVDGIRLMHDQAIYKPGLGANPDAEHRDVGNFGWHQDYAYWDYVNTDNLCTVWVALQDTDLSNGAMRTLVGSHRWGYDPKSKIQTQDLAGFKQRCEAEGKPWIDEPCVLKAGQASFHHALTYHGSGPNLSDQPRLSVVSHVMPDGSGYDPSG